jgi:uncharacterized SAM-binding protein YcdF (DUF218 family)
MRKARAAERGGITTRLIVLLFFLLFCAAIYAVRQPLLRWSADAWIVEDPLQRSDAVLLLGDDNFYADRATRAAELFRQGLAPLVVASGRRLRPNAATPELMEHDLIERGVPRDRIVRFVHDGDNTREEAEALTNLVESKRWKSVIVVTSNYRTRRTRYIFRHVLPAIVRVEIASARDGDFDPANWYQKRNASKRFIGEVAGMLETMWELRQKGDQHENAQLIVCSEAQRARYMV